MPSAVAFFSRAVEVLEAVMQSVVAVHPDASSLVRFLTHVWCLVSFVLCMITALGEGRFVAMLVIITYLAYCGHAGARLELALQPTANGKAVVAMTALVTMGLLGALIASPVKPAAHAFTTLIGIATAHSTWVAFS